MVSVIVAEIVATAVFVWIILGVTAPGSTTAGFAPLAIGLALTMLHLVMIPISNASLNPARSIATAVFGGPDALIQLWVFLVAPIVGGLHRRVHLASRCSAASSAGALRADDLPRPGVELAEVAGLPGAVRAPADAPTGRRARRRARRSRSRS